MRWPRLFRRRRAVTKAQPGMLYGAVRWAEVAFPPPLADPASSPVAESLAEPLAPEAAPAQSTVRLGFADGSSVEMDNASAESDAFHDAASRLLGVADL